jgi:DNA repair photolyase
VNVIPLNAYMNDIGNLRSHHWKHWVDLYENCAYDCKYCVYRSGDKMGKIYPLATSPESLAEQLQKTKSRGILYLGPKADVYQPMERKVLITRAVLQLLARERVPTFIVTRSELIRRDFDILQDMANDGLIEISVTIASASDHPSIEPNSPTVAERLSLIRELRRSGIPVSVHMSPIIPHLDSPEALLSLMQACVDAGAECIYACVLGMADRYFDVVRAALAKTDKRVELDKIYGGGNLRLDIVSADQLYIHDLMSHLADFSAKNALPFACVHIPEFDTVERTGHIFRFKLPNVGDIVRYFSRQGSSRVTFDEVRKFVSGFRAVDDAYLAALERFWHEGVLFRNTYFHQVTEGQNRWLERRGTLDLLVTNMKVGS